jgi:asparagine synthase (glutamine-hydrolysing)
MCGFIGSISDNNFQLEKLIEVNKKIQCRGPDQTKLISEKSDNLFSTNISLNLELVFNRLSIIDLSERASQPMISKTTNTGILFNGEIFNHRELKKDLEHKFNFKTSHSDTEVLLFGLTQYGTKFLERINGQFAIVFLDFNNEKIFLIRDRLGQKPLFYTHNAKELSFSSNLVSLAKLRDNHEVEERYLNQYLELGIIPSPNTLFKNIYKVKPAEVIEFSLRDRIQLTNKLNYWDIDEFIDDKKFIHEEFLSIFDDAVKIREESDVPISYFLSGGLDSTSIIKSAASSESGKKINTFSIVSDDNYYDESEYSNLVAEKFSSNHSKFSVNSDIDINLISSVISAYDELYFDPSVVPSYLLSKEMSKNFKVAISGDGGDELFGGYKRTLKILNKPSQLKSLFSNLYNIYPSFLGSGTNLKSNSKSWVKRYLSFYEDRKLMNMLNLKNEIQFFDMYEEKSLNYKNLLKLDYNFYLSEMMMYKIDRASMANSLEIRSPFVDNRLVEYIFSHDESYKNERITKPILNQYLEKDFDKDFLNRSKKGFVVNTSDWIYKNINHVDDVFKNGKIVYQIDKNIHKKLNINKSRINGLRLWKLYFLEKYFQINNL